VTAHDRFWADYLGLAPSDWDTPGVSVRAHRGLADYSGFWCFQRNARFAISAPPGWVDRLAPISGWDRTERLMEEDTWGELLSDHFVRFIGPAFHGCLDSDDFRPIRDEKVRFVSPADAAAVDRFRSECGAEDWEFSGLGRIVTGEPAALFEGRTIAAIAGYRALGPSAGDPCVLTHPLHRRRGCGAAVVSAIVSRALDEGMTLLYQTLVANEAAVGLAARLGSRPYATHVAVRLKGDRPDAFGPR
jgi:GNAT superfamily N-acetyltransferase